MKQRASQSRSQRKGGPSSGLCDRTSVRTRATSLRLLPTDDDHEGGPVPIPEYQSDQPSFWRLRPSRPLLHLHFGRTKPR